MNQAITSAAQPSSPRRRRFLPAAFSLAVVAALTACGGGGDDAPSPSPPASGSTLTPSEFELQMEASRLNTLSDPRMKAPWRAFYCNLPDDNNAIVLAERQKNNTRVQLTQLFDDVWYVGTEYVGQYILRNQDGFVMVDGGNNATEILNYNIPALQSLGWGPALPLHGVFLTHGHGDHDGGALQLKNSTNAAIYLGSADAAGKAYGPIPLDSANLQPYSITVGGREITVLSTPGHTAGATGFVVGAKDGTRDVKLFVSGGSSMSANNVVLVRAYLDSMERTYRLLKEQKVDTASNPHIYWDGSRDLIYKIQAEGLQSPSQFVIGNAKLLQAMAIGRTCTAAWLAKLDATAAVPVWRVSSVDFLAGSPSANRLVARVSNGWGPLAGKPVTFSLEGNAPFCTATSDANGVATCANVPAGLNVGTDRIVADFSGAQSEKTVDLGSQTTVLFEDERTSVCRDLAQVRSAIGSSRGDASYSARIDLNGDGLLNIQDVETITTLVPPGAPCSS